MAERHPDFRDTYAWTLTEHTADGDVVQHYTMTTMVFLEMVSERLLDNSRYQGAGQFAVVDVYRPLGIRRVIIPREEHPLKPDTYHYWWVSAETSPTGLVSLNSDWHYESWEILLERNNAWFRECVMEAQRGDYVQ